MMCGTYQVRHRGGLSQTARANARARLTNRLQLDHLPASRLPQGRLASFEGEYPVFDGVEHESDPIFAP